MTRAESKMSDAERRLRIAMLNQKISRQQLAQTLGIKVTTLGNIIRGHRCSPALKKKIHAALGVRIWFDAPVELHLGRNVEFVFPTVKSATEFIQECERAVGTGAVFRRSSKSRTVGFLKELVFVKDSPESPSPPLIYGPPNRAAAERNQPKNRGIIYRIRNFLPNTKSH